jgi:hypothetical protein
MDDEILHKLNILISELNKLSPVVNEFEKEKNKEQITGFLTIHTRIEQFLQNEFGLERSYYKEFQNHRPSFYKPHYRVIKNYQELLDAIQYDIKNNLTLELKMVRPDILLEFIFTNFSLFCQQISKRYNDRPTIEIVDEYDVQNIIHSILKLFFSDIRREVYNPQYLGKSTRIDFILNNENIGIEIKYADGLNPEKRIGDELLIDINHYKENRNCKKLICFIYNPNGAFNNPEGFKNELEKSKELPVKVYINP